MPKDFKSLSTIDTKTGEHEDGILVWIPKKDKSVFSKEGFAAMGQSASDWLAKQNLSKDAYRVFFALLARLDMENWINVSQVEVAESLEMQKQNLNRALKTLVKKDIILEGPKVGRNRTYRLNPHIGWKGSTKSHVVAISEHLKSRMDAAGISGVVTSETKPTQADLEADGQQRLFDE